MKRPRRQRTKPSWMATMWGVAKIKKALKAKVSRMCRTYCLQVWNKALNHAGVEASSALRRVKNVFYPPAIRALGPPSSSSPQAATVSKKADEDKGSPAKIPPSFTSPFKEAKQAKAIGKKKKTHPREWFLMPPSL